MSERAVVTVIRQHGDRGMAQTIADGLMAREMRKLRAELGVTRAADNKYYAAKIAEANRKYAVKHVGRVHTIILQTWALMNAPYLERKLRKEASKCF